MRVALLAIGLVGGWFVGVIIGYLVVALVTVATDGHPPDLSIPLLLGTLGAGIGAIVTGRILRDTS